MYTLNTLITGAIINYPIVCKQLISFSIRQEEEVGTRCFTANISSGWPFRLARYTELKVPACACVCVYMCACVCVCV